MKNRLKKILLFFLYIIQALIFRVVLTKKRFVKKKYYFSICAIFKDEANYLSEWIEYHKLLGVDHIYLYNNFSSDNYFDVLAGYIEESYITLIDWPIVRGQISAYEHCYKNYRLETSWIIFLDLDEFICPKYHTNINDWMREYERYPSVILYWLMFGTSGIINHDSDKFVIEQYTSSWSSIRNVGKIVLNTEFIPDRMYHHNIFCLVSLCGLKLKIPMINENKKFIFLPGHEKCPSNSSIQINHYWSKGLNEYVRKIDKGDIFSLKNEALRKKMDFFYWHEHKNISENKVIWRFLAELKIRMQSIKINFK